MPKSTHLLQLNSYLGAEIKRRELLIIGAAGASSLMLPSFSFGPKKPEVVGLLGFDKVNHLLLYDVESKKLDKISLPLTRAHSICQLEKSSILAVLEFSGRNGVLLDTRQPQKIRTFQASPGHFFSGHGVFDQTGNLYASEFSYQKYERGQISVRNIDDLKVDRTFASGGTHPHDMKWSPGGHGIYICNYGKLPKQTPSDLEASLTLLDPQSGKIIKRHILPEKNYRVCHLAVSSKEEIILAPTNSLMLNDKEASLRMENCNNPDMVLDKPLALNSLVGGLSDCGIYSLPNRVFAIRGSVQELETKIPIEKMLGPFSVCISDNNRQAAIAFRRGSILGFWNLDDFSLLGFVDFNDGGGPSGVVPIRGGSYYAVTTTKGFLYYVNAKTFKFERDNEIKPNLLYRTSHIVQIS